MVTASELTIAVLFFGVITTSTFEILLATTFGAAEQEQGE